MAGPHVCAPIDANGNLTSDGTRSFEWDARNQLLAVNIGTHRSEFTYDGQQRRIRAVEKENSVVQADAKVLWCLRGICEDRGADGVTVSRRPFGGGEQIGSALRFHATDHLGSVIGVADASATVLSRFAYDPWGRRSLTAGTDVTEGGYAEQEWHSETNLSFTLHRAYDPELGRWTSEDPSGLRAGPNLYTYANGLPTVLTDPSGLVAVEQHQLRIIPVSWKDVPTNNPGEVACGAVDSNCDLGGKCKCVNGRYSPRLWLKYAPVMYIATDAKTPARDVIKHEFTHHDINRGIVQAAVTEGTVLEGRGFDSKDQCEFRIQFWVDKWNANRGRANRNFDRWERFFGVGCRVQ